MESTPEEIARLGREKGLRILVFTDYSDRDWKYRFGLRLQKASILSKGIIEYLFEIKSAARKFEDMVILDGVEVSPFYYWEGTPFSLKCREYNRHILLFGLRTAEDFENLPLMTNQKSGFTPFNGNQGNTPYQNVIDYADKKGALSFWAHPEQEDDTRFLTAHLFTPAKPELLLETDGYTGFSAYPRGGKMIPEPGGIWDRVLLDFCQGNRKKPVWAIGESDYRKKKDQIDNPTTVFIDNIQNSKDVLDALQKGRTYPMERKINPLFLNRFDLIDQRLNQIASMGQTLQHSGSSITVNVDIEAPAGLKRVRLIKNGEVVFQTTVQTFNWTERTNLKQEKSFYRLMVESECGGRLLSNPVFTSSLMG